MMSISAQNLGTFLKFLSLIHAYNRPIHWTSVSSKNSHMYKFPSKAKATCRYADDTGGKLINLNNKMLAQMGNGNNFKALENSIK